ncbi:unnamed protein product [Symbiodinium necroappetens]|uniref:Uncharacterized protein n=1 Tax=Symbiodinium necroappetens TaxID=1628268 RepID=A0A812S860_9DINO|nr:unnamed protein product [Symbiodinium necroappetens]
MLPAENIPTVQNAAVVQGDRDPGPRQIPLDRGTVVNDPSGTREETGFVPPPTNVTGNGRDDVALGGYTYAGNCLVVKDWRVLAEDSGSDGMDVTWSSFWESGGTVAHAGGFNCFWDAYGFYNTPGTYVAKQLEAVMGDLNERLRVERRRAEGIFNPLRDYLSVMVIVAPEFTQELPQAIPHWSQM